MDPRPITTVPAYEDDDAEKPIIPVPYDDSENDDPPAPAVERNCIFYGRSYAPLEVPSGSILSPFVLIETNGNQCALIASAHAPCALEIEGVPVDWKICPRCVALAMWTGGRVVSFNGR